MAEQSMAASVPEASAALLLQGEAETPEICMRYQGLLLL